MHRTSSPPSRTTRAWLLVLVAAVSWWLVLVLPWLVGPARARARVEGASPLLPPLLADDLSLLLVAATVAGAAAGLLAGLARGRRRPAAAATGGGAVAAAVVVLGVSALRTTALPWSQAEPRLVAAVLGCVAAAALAGLAGGVLAVLGPPPVRPVALAVPATVLPLWVSALLPPAADSALLRQWLLALSLGVLLGLSATRPLHLLAWLPAAALVWAAQAALPAVAAAVVYAHAGYGLDDDPWLAVDAARDTFRAAWSEPSAHQVSALVAAVVLGLVVSAALGVVRARRPKRDDAPPAGELVPVEG